jgi:hypothetical protein
MIFPGFVTREKREYADFSIPAVGPQTKAASGFQRHCNKPGWKTFGAPLHKVPQVFFRAAVNLH